MKVILEEGDYHVASHALTLPKGSDFTFDLVLDADKVISGASYQNYTMSETVTGDKRYDRITFHQVQYSAVITLDIKDAVKITYEAGEISKEEYVVKNHERFNTFADYKYFDKDGCYLTGWRDGEEVISLGSRLSVQNNVVLQAIYHQESDSSLFELQELDGSRVSISKYKGEESVAVVPEKINGKNVISIESNAFDGLTLNELVLPPTLSEIKSNGIHHCDIGHLVFFDNLVTVDDNSFAETAIDDIRINAVTSPTYIRSYFGTYAEKMDRLIQIKDQKKIILYSGSSTRFGFDSELIAKTFKGYEVANMGVYAYSQSYPQIEIISKLLQKGDIVVISPEFDSIDKQIDLHPTLDSAFFAMIESNYDILRYLDIGKYKGFFDAFKEYQYNRSHMSRYTYQDSSYQYDEDGNHLTSPSYNRYGDYVVYRPNNEKREPFGVKRAFYNKSHFSEEALGRFNAGYSLIKEKEAKLYYDYSPRMNISLSEDSTPESIAALGEYLSASVDMPFLSTIDDSLMDPLYFYGTDNHLSTEGALIRTRRVISSLLDQLEG